MCQQNKGLFHFAMTKKQFLSAAGSKTIHLAKSLFYFIRHNFIANYPFIILFGVSCIPFLKWGAIGVIDPIDAYFPLDPANFLSNAASSWDFFGAKFGVFSFSQLSLCPVLVFPAFLQLLSLPINLINRVILIMLTFLSSLTMYFFVRVSPIKASRLGGLIAGLYYSLGPYMAGEIWLGHWMAMFTYMVAPIILFSISKMFDKDRWLKWSIILGLSSVFVLPRLRLLPYFVLVCIGLIIGLWYFKKQTKPAPSKKNG